MNIDPRIEPLTRLEDVRAPHNVVAAVGGLSAARDLIRALERGGVDGAHISLLGAQPAADAGEVSPEASHEPEGDVARGSAGGAAVGAGMAAVTGAAIGIPGVGPIIAGGLWAVFGAAVGASVGGVSSLGLSKAWDQTFEAVREGNVAVGVHTDDADEIEEAMVVMEASETLSVNRFDD
jgi:hypothetical protein